MNLFWLRWTLIPSQGFLLLLSPFVSVSSYLLTYVRRSNNTKASCNHLCKGNPVQCRFNTGHISTANLRSPKIVLLHFLLATILNLRISRATHAHPIHEYEGNIPGSHLCLLSTFNCYVYNRTALWTLSIRIGKSNQFMLFREIIAVCSEIFRNT
jgi:hypothetical protein